MAARFCGNCGTEVDDDAAFCPSCGHPIPAYDADDDATAIPAAPAWPPAPAPAPEESSPALGPPADDEPEPMAAPVADDAPASDATRDAWDSTPRGEWTEPADADEHPTGGWDAPAPAADEPPQPEPVGSFEPVAPPASRPAEGVTFRNPPAPVSATPRSAASTPPPATSTAPPAAMPDPGSRPGSGTPPPPASGPQIDLPITWPVTLSGWLIGGGAFVAAIGYVAELFAFRGGGNAMNILFLLAMLGIAATVFIASSIPAIPHLRLATLALVLVSLGIALDRLGFGAAGFGTLFVLLGSGAAVAGAIILELGRDQPMAGPMNRT